MEDKKGKEQLDESMQNININAQKQQAKSTTDNNLNITNNTLKIKENGKKVPNTHEEKKTEQTKQEAENKEKEEAGKVLDVRRHPDFSSFYEAIKKQTKDKTLYIDNLLNDNKPLRDVSINAWDIIKTFFWRLFCCWGSPFHNLCNYTRLRVGFNQLKIQQQISPNQNLSDSKLKCERLATLQSQLLAKQSDSETPEFRNRKNDLIN